MAVQGGSGTRAGRLSQTGRPSEPVKGSEYPFTGALSAVQASSMSGVRHLERCVVSGAKGTVDYRERRDRGKLRLGVLQRPAREAA